MNPSMSDLKVSNFKQFLKLVVTRTRQVFGNRWISKELDNQRFSNLIIHDIAIFDVSKSGGSIGKIRN